MFVQNTFGGSLNVSAAKFSTESSNNHSFLVKDLTSSQISSIHSCSSHKNNDDGYSTGGLCITFFSSYIILRLFMIKNRLITIIYTAFVSSFFFNSIWTCKLFNLCVLIKIKLKKYFFSVTLLKTKNDK